MRCALTPQSAGPYLSMRVAIIPRVQILNILSVSFYCTLHSWGVNRVGRLRRKNRMRVSFPFFSVEDANNEIVGWRTSLASYSLDVAKMTAMLPTRPKSGWG